MPFSKQNRKTTLALLGMVASLNAGSVFYVVQSGQTRAAQNCKANDAQNKILAKLIGESLAASDPKIKLTVKQQHAIRVFKEEQKKLNIPTCSNT